MKKCDIDFNKAVELYTKYRSLHKVAKDLHTSHLRVSKLFRENGISINNIGMSKILDEETIQDAINDYVVNHITMDEISKKYHITIKKLRLLFNEKGVVISKWNGHIKKEKPKKEEKVKQEKETKVCPYCGWKTIDIKGKANSYQIHLVHKHNIDLDEHLRLYPQDYELLKGEINRRKKKIQCKVCGKWLSIIDDRHLRKHNMTKSEYMEKYYGIPIISSETKRKLQQNMKKMMENDQWERKTSSYEKELEDFLISNHVSYEKHNRDILDGLELDFLIGDVAIEFNGNKFHTEFFGGRDKYYHLNKTNICNSKGIRLIQIFEDEYKFHRDIIYSKISHILGLDKNVMKIPGRKCSVKEINASTASLFLEKYHIQGFSKSSIYLGAFYCDELVAVMTFLREKDNRWNLTRFASKNGTICQGVGGKLFSYFIKTYDPHIVLSFADRRWTLSKDNNVYTKLGFTLDKILNPDYRYYNSFADKYKRFHKFGFRKQILHKKYGLPLTMTEKEMTRQLGFDRIWDCGLFRYVWRKR